MCALRYTELGYISALAQMWPSFISVSVLKAVTTVPDEAREVIISLGLPSRVRLLVLEPSERAQTEPQNFPINRLRNLAIQNCVTTHYVVVDSGTLLSRDASVALSRIENLYDELTSLNVAECQQRVATILPLLFLPPRQRNCRRNDTCLMEWVRRLRVTPREWRTMPTTKEGVRKELDAARLSLRSPTASRHVASTTRVDA